MNSLHYSGFVNITIKEALSSLMMDCEGDLTSMVKHIIPTVTYSMHDRKADNGSDVMITTFKWLGITIKHD